MKRRILLFAAFALMALMTPLGAKGQDYTGLTVRQARNHANDGHSVQFTGIVSYRWDNLNFQEIYMQDNDPFGAGITLEVLPSCYDIPNSVKEGTKIRVTAAQVKSIYDDVYIDDVTDISVISQNYGLAMTTPTLQQLKDLHYPITAQRVIADPFQHRLVKLSWLRIVEHASDNLYHCWVVEDLHGVKDTIKFRNDYLGYSYPMESIQVGQLYKEVRAIDLRFSDGCNGHGKLFVRSESDMILAPDEVNLYDARQMAGSNTEVAFKAVVNWAHGENNSGEIFVQSPSNASSTAGMRLRTNFNPSSRGITTGTEILVVGTPQIYYYGSAPDHVYINNPEVTVISQGNTLIADGPYSNLNQLKLNNQPAAVIKNNREQHHLVKVSNLTVTGLLNQGVNMYTIGGEVVYGYNVTDSQGHEDKLYVAQGSLSTGAVLPLVTVVNSRFHTQNGVELNLLLRSLDDIDYNTVTINYARIHLNQWHYIQGVVSYAYYVGGHPDNAQWVFVQDDTGGLFCEVYDEQHFLEVGDKVILKVYPTRQGQAVNIISELSYTEIASILDHNQSITPINLDMSAIYQQDVWFNNPGGNVVFQRLIRLQNLEIVGKDRPGDTFVLDVIESGNQSQHLSLELSAYSQNIHLTPSAFIDFYNSIEIGSVISSVTGVFDCRSNTYRPIFLRNPDDIEIQNPEPHNISFSLYPYNLEDLPETPIYASLSSNENAERITSAAPGTRVYLHAPNIDNNIGIEYLNPENYSPDLNPEGDNEQLFLHQLFGPNDLEIVTQWFQPRYFIMPDHDVEFRCLYAPSSYSYSDIWQAREGAMANANAPAKLAYLNGLVTHVIDSHHFVIQDDFNQYAPEDELKYYNGIIVNAANHNVQVGELVLVDGYPNGLSGNRIVVTDAVVSYNFGPSGKIERPYPTTLTGIYDDLHGSGQTLFNSRLQTRLVQLNDLYVVANLGNNQYRVRQTINNNSKEAILKVPASVSLSEGSYLGVIALNWSAADSQDIELILRSEADITGANDITISTYAMSFDEFGSGLNSSGSAYLWVNVPISIGSNLADMVQVGSANVSYTGNWIYDGTNATIEPLITYGKTSLRFCVPANPTTETRTCAITIHAGSISSQSLVITQTGCAPAEFTVSPNFQSFGPVDPEYSNRGHYSQSGYINITDISHVAQPYGSHISTSVVSAYAGQTADWFSLGAWDAENQRFPFTISNNNDPTSMNRGVEVAIIMEGTDGTLVQHEATVYQSGPGASVTVTPNWWTTEAPLCQEVTKTFEVNYTNFDLSINPARIYLEASGFYDDDVEVSIEPSDYVELTEAAGTIYYQVTFLVKNAGSHYGTFMAKVQEQDNGDWWDSFDSQEASMWVSGLHPYNIDTKATSTETLNSLGFPSWYVMDPNTYQFVDTLSFIQVSIASEALGQQAEMCMPDPENNGFVITCMPFDPTYVSGSNTLIPLHDGTYLIQLQGSWLAWDSGQGLHEEWVPLNTPDDIANIPVKNKWNISFSGENAIINPSTNPNYSLRCQSVTITEPDPENWDEMITRIEYRIACVTEGGTPLQIFYHIEGELPSPTFSEATPYFYDGQSVSVTITPAEGTTLAYTLEEDYDNPVTSNVPVTLTFTETTKVIAWSMLECQTYSLDGLVERTYYKIHTIAESRANANTEYYIHGIVSCADHVHNRYFVQDETSGVEINIDWSLWEGWYNNHDTLVSLQYGDEIVLKGWYDGYWFTGATYDWNTSTTYDEPEVARLSTGNTVTPVLVTFDELYENTDGQYTGRLVTLENEQVTVSNLYPETYMLRHGTLEEPYYLEFPRYMENSDEMFPLNNGDIIDLTAIYTDGFFNNPKEIVKGISLTVEGYGNSENGKWVFIASPVEGSIMPVKVDNIFSNDFDLYRFDQAEELEWRNYKANSFNLANGQGYLYGSAEDVTLVFKGDFFDGNSKTVNLNYSDGNDFSGWNLVGNPFTTQARINRSYYKMNAEGTAIEAVSAYSTINIAPCTGVMVEAEGSNETVTFTKQSRESASNQGLLNITLSKVVEPVETPTDKENGPSTLRQAQGPETVVSTFVDNAIVSFNEGDRLSKFSFSESDAILSLPQDGKDYAIVYSQGQGEMPLNFKAAKDGTYTLSFSSQEVSFSYLHLIDNMTGADIDFLSGDCGSKPAMTNTEPETLIAGEDPQSLVPSYTFTAKTTDYASRFRLVFSAKDNEDGPSTGSGTFAFYNGSEWEIANTGLATLQVVDVTGRVLSSETIDGNATMNTNGLSAGIYMMRLMNGDSVRTQKIVVK